MNKLLILLVLFYCGCHTKQQNGMPAERPKDLELHYHSDGGMLDHAEDINIGADSCVYNVRDNGKQTHRLFSLSSKEMDGLYDVLKKNEIDKITYTTESNVYDRGGVSIQVEWNKNQQISIDDSQGSFVKENWRKQWEEVCGYLEKLVKEH